jgi:hypothetical protein
MARNFSPGAHVLRMIAESGRYTFGLIDQLINLRLAAQIPDYRSTPLEYIWQGTAWLNSSLLPRCVRRIQGVARYCGLVNALTPDFEAILAGMIEVEADHG